MIVPQGDADLIRQANLLHESGHFAAAGQIYRTILQERPRDPEALWRLGDVAHRLGLADQAWPLVEASLSIDPAGHAAWNCRGVLLAQRGRLAEANEAFERATSLAPAYTAALSNLGKARLELGRIDEAIAIHRRCSALEPNFAAHHLALGQALLKARQYAEATQEFERAEALAPDAAAPLGKGLVLAAQREFTRAADCFARAVALQPNLFEAQFNLGLAHYQAGRLDAALPALRAAVACNPGNATAHANLIFAMQLDPQSSMEAEFNERRLWQARHARFDGERFTEHANSPNPNRVLRVGYVSGDFKAHSVSEIFGTVVLNHTPQIEVVCYSQTRDPDHVTELYRKTAYRWRDVRNLSDAALAQQIRDDGIDILVDLSGFTQDSRLTMFARKPAPIQVQAWGQPFGSGMEAMDYVLGDAIVFPEDQRQFFTEEIYDLPCCLAFPPPPAAPLVMPLPADRNGFVTFGSFNRLTKISSTALQLWANLLSRLPDARLLAKDPALDDSGARRWFLDSLGALGVAADRIELRGKTSQEEHFAAYSEADIALDPIPNTGGATTFGCCWMGLPVVTLLDRRPSGRISASLLSAIGLDEFVAQSEAEFIDIAGSLARDTARLRSMRQDLRDRLKNSILCDHRTYTDTVETAYRGFWRRWCLAYDTNIQVRTNQPGAAPVVPY